MPKEVEDTTSERMATLDDLRNMSHSIKSEGIKDTKELIHNYNVALDALEIANSIPDNVDVRVLAIASFIQDCPDVLSSYQIGQGLKEKVQKVLEETSGDYHIAGLESKILTAALIANHTSLPKFEKTHEEIQTYSNRNVKRHWISELSRLYKDQWISDVHSLANSEIFNEFPKAREIFNKRMNETHDFIKKGGQGHETFKTWSDAYNASFEELGVPSNL